MPVRSRGLPTIRVPTEVVVQREVDESAVQRRLRDRQPTMSSRYGRRSRVVFAFIQCIYLVYTYDAPRIHQICTTYILLSISRGRCGRLG